MDPQGQFSVSHILGQCVDVTNYSTFQHQFHSYGNITVAPAAHTLHAPDTLAAAPHIASAATNIVTVGYATHAVQSYPAVINNANPHLPPPTQVQYISYDAPGVSIRPHTFHAYHAHPSPIPPPTISQGKCSSTLQTVDIPSSPSSDPQTASKEIQEPLVINEGGVTKEKAKYKKRHSKEETTSAKQIRKKCRNRGEAYTNVVGRLVEAKKYVDRDCECKNKCVSKLGTVADRDKIFKSFWALGDFEKQNLHIAESVVLVPTMGVKRKAHIQEEKNLKTVTRKYFVDLPSTGERVRVCKSMFLCLHGVSNGRLDRVLQAVNCNSPSALQDQRGHHSPSNKTASEDVDFARQHILTLRRWKESSLIITSSTSNVFMSSKQAGNQQGHQPSPLVTVPHQEHSLVTTPSVASEQQEQQQQQPSLRTNTDTRSPREMSVKKMYESYKLTCEQERRSPVSLWVYRQIEKSEVCPQTNHSIRVLNSPTSYSTKERNEVLCDPSIHQSEDCVNQFVSDTRTHTVLKENKPTNERGKMSKRERKARRNSGKEYITSSGKIKSRKVYVDQECGCRYQCIPGIGNEEMRRQVFERFWAMANFTLQNQYIAEKVSLMPVGTRGGQGGLRVARTTNKLARTHSRIYYVPIKEGEEPVRVCKMAFLQLHGLSNGRVDRVLQAVAARSPFALKDRRGHHTPKNKTPEDAVNHALCHLLSLFNENAEEAREPGPLKVEKMYRLYSQLCRREGRRPIGNFVYRKILKHREVQQDGSIINDTCETSSS
ncbi:hypothetical protein Pcinc_014813 [Petrolisthes cinctipes]|uniref:Uncharacterized protein n=1 Tax=Petrolisthes cinctipes TaxID=88211 RepID=A0AAE1FVT9_PETCI|nr:hypothetical protein Pcinc_014813 [Petrolisthes cinctipes]